MFLGLHIHLFPKEYLFIFYWLPGIISDTMEIQANNTWLLSLRNCQFRSEENVIYNYICVSYNYIHMYSVVFLIYRVTCNKRERRKQFKRIFQDETKSEFLMALPNVLFWQLLLRSENWKRHYIDLGPLAKEASALLPLKGHLESLHPL